VQENNDCFLMIVFTDGRTTRILIDHRICPHPDGPAP